MKTVMKCAFLFVVACLAVTLAAVPFYDRRNIDLPPGSHGEGSMIATPPRDNKTDEDGDGYTKSSNITSIITAGIKDEFQSDEWRLDMRMGGPEQHIGTVNAERLYKKVKKCLYELTELHFDSDYKREKCKEFNPNFCKDINPYCADHCDLPNMVYANGNKNMSLPGSYVRMHMIWGEVWDSNHNGLREIAFDLIAIMLKKSTD